MGSEKRYLRRKDEIREKAGKRGFRGVVGDGDVQWSLRGICIFVKIRERFLGKIRERYYDTIECRHGKY